MSVLFSICALATLACVALALQAPNVTGQAVRTDPNDPNAPAKYEVKITLHPGDPTIHDFHMYWENAPGAPTQSSWSGPNGNWSANVADNTIPPSGTPGGFDRVDSVSFTSAGGMQAGTGPTTFTFTFEPYGGGGTQPPPRTVYWYATTDGTYGLPGDGIADEDVEGWGLVNLAGQWNFPAW